MGRLIDCNDVYNAIQITTDNFGVAKKVVEDNMLTMLSKIETVEAIPIPKDATNEDILKAVFPNDADDIIKYIKAAILNGWLNSKYEEKKNNEN